MADYNTAKEEIKSRCNIVDVISAVVPLTKSGSNWKGCCPFHKEKTPSFMVSETRQTYHCFGCGEGGDAITFTMKYYNLTYIEAIERLATQYGVVINVGNDGDVTKRNAYYDVNKKAAEYFWNVLKTGENPGLKYMQGRGIEPKTMQLFGIGYADDDWQSLTDALLSQGVDKQLLQDLNLSFVSAKNGNLYDKFRGRVMFPIIDTRKHVIGFGGRIIGEGEPKYLNSNESEIFLKKNNLYGINLSKTAIQQEGFAFLVEGYMDVVSLYQSGVQNVAASLGTALTDNQAKLLKKYTKKVVLCYDSDAAGVKAALRGIDILRPQGLEVKVLNVEGAKDPDEYIKKFGKEAFLKLTREKAVTDVDYKVKLIGKKYDVSDTDEGIKYLKAVSTVLGELSPVEADIYIKKVAKESGISEGALRREVEKTTSGVVPQSSEKNENSEKENKQDLSNKVKDDSSVMLEKTMLRLALLHSDYFSAFDEFYEIIATTEGEQLRKALQAEYKSGSDFQIDAIRDRLEGNVLAYFDRILADIQPGDDKAVYEDCITKLKTNRIDDRLKQLFGALDIIGDDSKADEIMHEISQLQKQKKQLRK